ncbi:MAG: tetratricopeptide repeat protein [Armatimonadota bacterium]|nr:tetratricopeptide repeat protein [Armatimonadota bacterium]
MLARNRAGLTQQALGAPDLSKSFISLLESGRSYPSVETVIALARRMHTSVGSLLFDPADLRQEIALSLLHLASALDPRTAGDDALRLLAATEGVLVPLPPALHAQVLLHRARVLLARGQVEDARRLLTEAAALAARHRLEGPASQALALQGMAALCQEDVDAARPLLEQAVDAMRRSKTARTEEHVRALIALGSVHVRSGHPERGQRAYRRALDLATRLRAPRLRGYALWGLGVAACVRRHPEQAAAWLEQAVQSLQQDGSPEDLCGALTALGVARCLQGRYGDALAVLQRALRLQEQYQADPVHRSEAWSRLAQVLLAIDRRGDAARAARRALRDAQAAGARAAEAQAQVTLARVLYAQGRRTEAVEALRDAQTALKRTGHAQQAATAAALLALWTREQPAAGEGGPSGPAAASLALDPPPFPPVVV